MKHLALAAFVLTLVADVLMPAVAQTTPTQAIPAELNVPMPPIPVIAEGRRHYVYELHVANYGRADLTLRRLEVLADRDSSVASYEGNDLANLIARPGASGDERLRLPGGAHATIFIDVITSAQSAILGRFRHRLTFDPVRMEGGAEQISLEGAEISIRGQEPVVLSPPLRGAGWVTLNGLSNLSSHRRTVLALNGRATIAQRFAVDFSRVGSDGLAFRGDAANNANWSPYGADVLAVAAGRVVALRDGLPENDPTSDTKAITITVDTATGNYIVLNIGHGRYVLYAHLKPGAFHVHVGDRVRAGQVLAALGNSGKSDAPHLHFHVMNGPAPLASEGLPFVLRDFDIQGHVDSLGELVQGGWHATGPVQHAHNEMPVLNAVVAFP